LLGIPFAIACGTTPPAPDRPDVVIVEKEVSKTVQVRCEDRRDQRPDIPGDDDFAAVNQDDPLAIVILSRLYRGAIKIYETQLKAADDQIRACRGDE